MTHDDRVVLAKIQGNHAQAHDALMLDQDGYVSETNATNVFVVKGREVWTPHADSCLPGTRSPTTLACR